jgi:O-antigen/teichoic acid export membrane protein
MRRSPRGLSHQAMSVVAISALAQVISIVMLVVVASRSNPRSFGHVAAIIGAVGFLVGIMDFGSSGYTLRELSSDRMSSETYWTRSRTRLLVSVIAGVALGAVVLRPSGEVAALSAVVLVVGRTTWLLLGAPVRAALHSDRWALTLLADRGTGIAILTVALSLHVAPITAYWLALSVGAAASIVCAVLLRPDGLDLLTSRGLANPWRGCAGFATSTVAMSVASLDVVVLGAVAGGYQAGIYGAVNRWTQPIQLLADAFAQVAAPFMAAARTGRMAVAQVRRSIWIPGLGFGVALAMVLLAPRLVGVLLGPAYAESASTLALLASGAALVLVNQPLATLLQARGHDRAVGWGLATFSTVQMVGIVTVGREFGADGAALAYLTAQAVLLAWLLVIVSRLVPRYATPAGGAARWRSDAD